MTLLALLLSFVSIGSAKHKLQGITLRGFGMAADRRQGAAPAR